MAADTSTDSTYVMVPPDAKYTISGNNSDGFIVTVDTGEIQSGDAAAAAATTPEDSAAADTETATETSAAE
ncbi:MAG: hypothetical protein ACLR5S_05370 [Ruminococcus sp.]